MRERFADADAIMRRAIQLAARGLGHVEPNPPVGAVIVDDKLRLIGEGFHERYGGPHAEVNAIHSAGKQTYGSTLFVSLEPCCHHGKTGPCTTAIIDAGIRKVVVAATDPAPEVNGGGIAALEAAGIEVELGRLRAESLRLLAPFIKRVTTGLPYVHAKWAMTLDGKIASRTGASRWISGEESRRIVHTLRGRMDAILTGLGTVVMDDPLLTARPPGPRVAARVVLDSRARLPLDSQLVRTVKEAPVMVVACETAAQRDVDQLLRADVEVLKLPASDRTGGESRPWPDLQLLFHELGRRGMTNVFAEGGSRLLGSLFDRELIDEVHVFLAPKLLGGRQAPTPMAGEGLLEVPGLPQLAEPEIEIVPPDVYIHGPLRGVVAGDQSAE